VFVYGYSSGALLALLGAARPLPIAKLALLEPPIQEPGARPDPLTTQLAALVTEGRFSDVVEHFHRSIGVPDDYIAQMRATPAFAKMTAIAPTFVYDCRISDAITPTHLTAVETPTLVLDSAGSTDDLTGSAASVARYSSPATCTRRRRPCSRSLATTGVRRRYSPPQEWWRWRVRVVSRGFA